MPSEINKGSGSIGGTEWSLTGNASGPLANTTAAVAQAFIWVGNMAAGDEYQIRAYEKIYTTQFLIEEWILTYAQPRPLWASPALILLTGWDFTIKKLAGTDRAMEWSVRKA